MKKPLIIFVAIPLLINLLLIGLYFSGSAALQQWAAPTIDWLPRNSWREFGLLEMLQNLFLLAVIGILLLTAVRASYLLDKLCFVGAAAVFLFLFAEEIDYGIHFYEFVTGEYSGIEQRNWHNRRIDGQQNVKRFKQLMDVIMAMLFIVLPLVKNRIPIAFLQTIAPSRWFIAGFAVGIGMANVAHLLDDAGLATLNGVAGNLEGNISEFRELSNYYFFLIYALQLWRTGRIFGPAPEPEEPPAATA